MTKEQVYDVWASPNSPWTRWAKPVLFSFIDTGDREVRQRPSRPWDVTMTQGTTLVIDCPGTEGVEVGIECAKAGYRPTPLYNACPYAIFSSSTFDSYSDDLVTSILKTKTVVGAAPAVDVALIMQALCETAETLSQLQLPSDAPPAFLLDADRRGYTLFPDPGSFDNRSIVSKTDFPSAELLRQNGIKEVVLVQKQGNIQPDLLQILLAWQAGGMVVARQIPWSTWSPQKIKVKKPLFFFYIWQRLLLALGYRCNEFGAFGTLVRSSHS